MYVCQVTSLNTPRIMLQTTDHDELTIFFCYHFQTHLTLQTQTYLKRTFVQVFVGNKEVRSSSFVIFCPSVHAWIRFLKGQFIIFRKRIVVSLQLRTYNELRIIFSIFRMMITVFQRQDDKIFKNWATKHYISYRRRVLCKFT